MNKLKAFLVLSGIFLSTTLFAKVNINSATKEQLESLMGVGPVRAQAIVDYRTHNGPFQSLDQLKNVDGVGTGVYELIKSDISLSGATTTDNKSAAQKEGEKADKKEKVAKGKAKKAAGEEQAVVKKEKKAKKEKDSAKKVVKKAKGDSKKVAKKAKGSDKKPKKKAAGEAQP